MTYAQLTSIAESVVGATLSKLPTSVRQIASAVPVIYHDWPSDEILGEEFEDDILGLFVGDPVGAESGLSNVAPAHILLFLENIFDLAEGDEAVFRSEVRLTYLHELGHY